MLNGRDVLQAAGRYFRGHPEELARVVRGGLGLRLGVPLAAFRWLIGELVEDVRGLDPEITAQPPGLRVAATFEKMETRLRFSAVITVHRIELSEKATLLDLRFDQVALSVISPKKTILSALVKSGALDVSQIGNLVSELPGLPPMIVEAKGQRIVFDLLRSPRLDNDAVRHIVGALSHLITLHGVETDTDHLDLVFRALPRGGLSAVSAVRRHLVRPGIARARALLNGESERALAQVM
jgi:hypothetical protein